MTTGRVAKAIFQNKTAIGHPSQRDFPRKMIAGRLTLDIFAAKLTTGRRTAGRPQTNHPLPTRSRRRRLERKGHSPGGVRQGFEYAESAASRAFSLALAVGGILATTQIFSLVILLTAR